MNTSKQGLVFKRKCQALVLLSQGAFPKFNFKSRNASDKENGVTNHSDRSTCYPEKKLIFFCQKTNA